MPYCSNCGKQVSQGAKFCFECGKPIGAETRQSTNRKTVYDGEVHKCPNCGEMLKSMTAICPACGNEIRSNNSSNAIILFARKLEIAKDEEQRIGLIKNFTVPNTKEDIIEFFILASTNAEGDSASNEMVNAWLVKLEQCHHKAELMLCEDPDYDKLIRIYNETYLKLKKAKRKKTIKKDTTNNTKPIIAILRAIPKCLGMIAAMIAFCMAISVDISGENGVGYELVGGILLIVSAWSLGRNNVSYAEFLICAICGIMSFILAKQLDNGAFLQLIGFVVLVIVTVNYFRKLNRNKGTD